MTSVISQRPQVNADELLPVGTRVRFVLSAKAYEGFVAYAGETEFSDGLWLGVVLDEASGKNDGEVQGKRYFECAPLHGMFIRPGVVTRANKARKSAEDLLRPPRSKIIRRAKSTGELQEDDDAERAKLSLTAPAGKVVRKKLSISTKKKKKNNVVNGDRPEHNDCASESGESTGSSAASEHCELGEPQSHSIDCTQLLSSTRRRSSKMRRSLDEQAHLEVEQLKNDLVEARMELAAQFSEENARKATLSEQTVEMASLTAKLKAADDEYAIKLREAMIEKNEAMVERNEEMVGRSEASAVASADGGKLAESKLREEVKVKVKETKAVGEDLNEEVIALKARLRSEEEACREIASEARAQQVTNACGKKSEEFMESSKRRILEPSKSSRQNASSASFWGALQALPASLSRGGLLGLTCCAARPPASSMASLEERPGLGMTRKSTYRRRVHLRGSNE